MKKILNSYTASQCKKIGHSCPVVKDWEDIKVQIMHDVCTAKFIQNPVLKKKLVATGNCLLEEGNTWGDNYWGVVKGKGKNWLGVILMKIRQDLC